MTTTHACRNCGAPSAGPYCAAHDVIQPTASRRTPVVGALAPALQVLSLSEHELRAFADDVVDRYEQAAARVHPGNPAIWAMLAREDALTALLARHALPPLRRTPAGGVATLERVITVAQQHQREQYAPAGMVACCVVCTPVSWWFTEPDRDAHVAEQHPLPDHPPP